MSEFQRLLVPFLVSLLLTTTVAAQDMENVEVEVHPVADGVYMLTGAGGNIGLVATDDGAFLIDDQFAPLTERILAATASVTDQPVKFVFNTHWHGDHTGGNENLAAEGSVIVAHDNVHRRMSAVQFSKTFERETPPAPPGALPVVTFNDTVTFHMGAQTVHAFHLPNAHTDGDAVVHLRDADVIHTGDVVFYGLYPFVDIDSGGSLPGMIAAVERILELAGPDTRIIPGHGPMIGREQLTEYHNLLDTVHTRLTERIDQEQSLEEIQAAGITAEWDEQWGGGFLPTERWVELLYRDLTGDDSNR